GSTALYFLVFGELINAGAGSVGYMLMMTGRPKMNLINAIILCLMTLGLGLWLIPQYGILGAALTTAVSVAIINILRLIEVYYFERIHPYNQYFTKPIVAGVCSLIFVLVFRYFIPTTNGVYTMVSILLFGLVFIATLIFLKLQQEDKYVLKLITRKVSLLF
ncbi:MAG: polysaccharide biosynthesis C-terminal domain-containing protein, partial [bacterium]